LGVSLRLEAVTELARGVYERLVTEAISDALGSVDAELIQRRLIDPVDAHEILSRHVAFLVRRALRIKGGDGPRAVTEQVNLVNRIADFIAREVPEAGDADDLVAPSNDVLLSLANRAGPGAVRHPERPEVPFSASALLVNGRDQPRIGTEVQRELASADQVDLLCAFVKWHGVRILEDQLDAFVRRGGRLRLITTTYIGATEQRAVNRLAELGAEIRISYETHMTRLHAKAWLFRRDSGFSTAYVGSSNLSRAAMIDGLEWNVRLSNVEQPHLLETFAATFDEYWEDPAFEPYDPSRPEDRERLRGALAIERTGPTELPLEITSLEIRPWGYQREILDELEAERTVHGHSKNLIVMATGTGKTIVAGLDYRRLSEAGLVDSLLFVAHREEILGQAMATFRHIVRSGSFGEKLVGGERPNEWRHVFASVQSLSRINLDELNPGQFDMVIVDEFHHAMAPTYERLLHHLAPRQLVGLTATPERADGTDVRVWFDGRTAVELRLWEALERGLLAPFQYFGLHDGTDLTSIRWKRGAGYDVADLTKVYTGHDARVRIVLQGLIDKVPDVSRMRALGFCVSIDHADFMARKFNEAGIPSLAVTSRTTPEARAAGLAALRQRTVNVLFTVDLFNEGVDVPEIDTVLFLRPTESATVFLQQLGRGLRLADEKPCLTALDFIGHQHADFRFDLRLRALTGTSRRQLERDIERGFPSLPAGCHIELDRVASEIVMSNVRSSLRINWQGLVSELRRVGQCSLSQFLDETGLAPDDIYRRRRGGWIGLRRLAGLDQRPAGEDDDRLSAAFGRMLHVDDLERLNFMSEVLSREAPPSVPALESRDGRLMAMMHFALWGANEPLSGIESGLERLWVNAARREELRELVGLLRARIRRVTHALDGASRVPLQVHARYSRDEALAAFGVPQPGAMRQGVRWVEEEQADVFFVTLRKTEKHYSPTTMYADRAITPSLFQWESQSTTSEASPTGQRYVNHEARGSTVHLFVRETKEADGDLGAPPYCYAGTADYVSHSGDRPMKIIWHLKAELPADVFHAARVAAG
jgi:superfamily II DNA or RNA helicase/HKD family nuclease